MRTGGLEPPTSRLSGERSNRLSYARVEADNLLNVHDPATFRAVRHGQTKPGVGNAADKFSGSPEVVGLQRRQVLDHKHVGP